MGMGGLSEGPVTEGGLPAPPAGTLRAGLGTRNKELAATGPWPPALLRMVRGRASTAKLHGAGTSCSPGDRCHPMPCLLRCPASSDRCHTGPMLGHVTSIKGAGAGGGTFNDSGCQVSQWEIRALCNPTALLSNPHALIRESWVGVLIQQR